MRPARFTLSIKQIALALITGLLVAVSLVGAFAAWQTRSVTQSLARSNLDAAHSELSAATERLFRRAANQADTLAHWDETRQQLVLPEYYAYWRDQRVYEAGILNSRHARAALYDNQRRLLSNNTTNDTEPGSLAARFPRPGFPDTLPQAAQLLPGASWLANEGGTMVVYQAFPVYSDEHQHSLLGYGLLRFDFMGELLARESFHFVEMGSVALALKPGETLAQNALFSRLNFKARSDPNQARFQTILSRALITLFLLVAGAALLAFLVYNRLLIRPLHQLSRDIDTMQQGRSPSVNRPSAMHVVELESIRRSLHEYQAQLRELHGSLENQNREFRSQARQDALTGCYNRRAYEEDWERFRTDFRHMHEGAAFLLFDCDRFKAINDTYGHAKGDRVLTLIADALVMALRANDRLYRLGGDEFATFLARTSPAQAKQIAQRCQSLIEAGSFGDLGISEPVGISIGIAFCSAGQPENVGDLPKQADIAMYTAKQPGRARIAVYGEDTERASQTLVANRETSALFQALATPGMIEMHYQAIHALPDRKVDYYEALARIRYHGELIMPGAFLPVVSARRLETEFDLAVLAQVDADLSSGMIPEGIGVSINLSAQTISRAEVVSHLLELSRHTARHALMIEITETSLITQVAEVSTYLDLLRTVHFRIAMDDFGAGYSPLRYLADLPVEVVKLDISLISKLAQDNRAARVVADFVRMMADAGYSLVAEGVETEAVLQKVQQLGIAHVQGYLLGRPTPLDRLADAVADDIATQPARSA
ncbi:MAG: GGDEF-domain containing protein [Hydrogenophilales bacterium 16-64-46]|nr:MAG: GGDEF-domain containing protein [Hydrogenophilales bacterium 16-64-46]OZA37632.1 MAG: GGDEF-domain containing protein [Hydrogenophilales bacterium 17-64-34]HQT01089.1 EAL domain-containing protein [Thiobacillus sp.]